MLTCMLIYPVSRFFLNIYYLLEKVDKSFKYDMNVIVIAFTFAMIFYFTTYYNNIIQFWCISFVFVKSEFVKSNVVFYCVS